MIRFVDIRDQHCGGRFAWFNTVTDEFEKHGSSMVWEDWRDFASDYCGWCNIERYRALCPPWAFTPAVDDDEPAPAVADSAPAA